MRQSALRVQQMVEGASFDDFEPDSMLRLATERALEIIGEAARRVSPDFQERHREIPWRDIIGQRNVLAHEYGMVDGRRLWHTAIQDVPRLIDAINQILPRDSAN
jgi:uncharacterized protein with HEPN domain